jgi:AbiV family abortive infection protein
MGDLAGSRDSRTPGAYAMNVDLAAVKAAATPDLVKCAVGAAANAQGLLDDAQVLSAAARHARAYALAALAVEEAGKAISLTALVIMPGSLRAQAPVGRMLEWHQLKLVGGMLIAAVPPGSRTMAAQLTAMAPSQVAEVLDNAQVLAQDQDRLKQRGLYADMDRSGRVRLPSEVTSADAAAQLRRARRAVSSASVLLGPRAPAFLADPPAETIEFCRALVSAFAEARNGRTPQAAADVWLDAVHKLRQQIPASDTKGSE